MGSSTNPILMFKGVERPPQFVSGIGTRNKETRTNPAKHSGRKIMTVPGCRVGMPGKARTTDETTRTREASYVTPLLATPTRHRPR